MQKRSGTQRGDRQGWTRALDLEGGTETASVYSAEIEGDVERLLVRRQVDVPANGGLDQPMRA